MNHRMFAGLSALAAGLVGCAGGDLEAPSVAVAESAEIATCGANADPTTGVMCWFFVSYSDRGFVSSTIVEKNTLDYVRCTWAVDCSADPTPYSSGGTQCLSVIGTGCSPRADSRNYVYDVLMPPGSTADQKDQICRNNPPNGYNDLRPVCLPLGAKAEQWEDLCCLPRVAPPPPPPPGPGSGSGTPSSATSGG